MAVAQAYANRPVDIRVGDFELRLAETAAEIEEAQALRYRIFYEEMDAQPSAEMAEARRDFDGFDSFCDHLLIIDHKLGGKGKVIEFQDEEIEKLQRRVAEKLGYKLVDHRLELYAVPVTSGGSRKHKSETK